MRLESSSALTTFLLLLVVGCSQLGAAEAGCAPGSRTGSPGKTGGPLYDVFTPSDYDSVSRYPLIVVYPGYTDDKAYMEKLTRLAGPATAAGYVIAFTDHYSPVDSYRNTDYGEIVAASRVPDSIANRWCIDRSRLFLVGNSDGSSIALEIILNKLLDPPPVAVVVNAVGVNEAFLKFQECPPPLVFMSMHGTKDTVFEISDGYGVDVADWWAKCNGCKSPLGEAPGLTCHDYAGCPPDASVTYCQYSGKHAAWEKSFDRRILAFFARLSH